MKTVKADEEGLEAAAKALNGGGVAIVPTDTVYGCGRKTVFYKGPRRAKANSPAGG